MAGSSSSSPAFAGRYRFEPMDDHWDRGLSGFTSLVYDLKERRLGVIKRAEITSKRSTEGLKNEEKALKALTGLGVPDVYDIGQAVYDSKNYDYMVIEYVDAIRVEKSLDSLSIVERAEIITGLFSLLAQAHQKGIVNGDVDLKHLFWRKDKGQLVIIDWGNARLDVDPKKKTEFAYDMARAAEIIFSLVTYRGHLPATGSIALPDATAVVAGLEPLPNEFRVLCEWAPRTPSNGVAAPYTAKEIFEVSKKWLDAIRLAKAFKQPPALRQTWLLGGLVLSAVVVLLLTTSRFSPLFHGTASDTPTLNAPETQSLAASTTPLSIETTLPTVLPTESITLTPEIISSPGTYSSIMTFDQSFTPDNRCWENKALSPAKLLSLPADGFYQRSDRNWGFNVGQGHSIEEIVQVDFRNCLDAKNIDAFALNVFVKRLEQPLYEPSREFGVFLQNQGGRRREYLLWLDGNNMFLRIRENDKILKDYPIQIVNPANVSLDGEYPRPHRSFRIQLFLEINNQGSDIIYLLEGPLVETVRAEDIDPSRMFRIDDAVLPTLGSIQEFGLVGHGGKTETLVWPLTLLQKASR